MKKPKKETVLYQVDGDLYTTKAPECPECGFTVNKKGQCTWCG